MTEPLTQRGITLIELVVVLSLLGIIAAAAAVALRDPVRAYVDSTRRAELTDVADVSLRRMGRDIRLALPNSPRVTESGGTFYLELLLTKTGGRYRTEGPGDILDFSAADTTFESLSPLGAGGHAPEGGDILVVHNLFSTGSTQANAYTFGQSECTDPLSTECNTAAISNVAGNTITFGSRRFPLSSPGHRFYVVEGPVTYACTPGAPDSNGNGTGSFRRTANYTIDADQPTPDGGDLLAANVTGCQITYTPLVLNQRLGLVTMQLQLTLGNESVTLYHEVHVSNVP